MGALIQLVAIGKQESVLTGNPQITFFKAVYRRHTNFAIESVQHSFNGTADFGQDFSADIDSHGDLIHKVYFQTDLPKIDVSSNISTGATTYRAFRWLNWIGHILFDKISINIGSSEIDKHNGEWLHLWHELTCPEDKRSAYAEMVGNVPKLTQIYSTNSSDECLVKSHTLYIPFQFWFCRNPGLAYPLIATKDSKFYINIKLRKFNDCIWACEQSAENIYGATLNQASDALGNQSLALTNSYLYVDYIFLGDDEKRKFLNNSHTYLIETLQTRGTESFNSVNTDIKLSFTHPVKELVWVAQPTNFISNDYSFSRAGRQYYNYTDLWDYNGFTGTPEPSNGAGLSGGRRNHNSLGGNPEVLVEGQLNKNNQWATTITSGSTNIKDSNAGYTDIAQYTRPNSVNTFSNRNGIWNGTGNIRHDQGENPVKIGNIFIGGSARFTERNGNYFNLVQPYQHHTNIPAPGINIYSFALHPENNQPSGTCNFSEIDNKHLKLTLTDDSVNTNYNSGNVNISVYAVNYNVLAISNNKAILAYAS